jgi:hypothetical protein
MVEAPWWRKPYDAAERRVAPPLERLVQSPSFAEVTAGVMRLRATTRNWAEQRSRRLWHAANLPAGSDVRQLRDQLTALERQMRRLTAESEDGRNEGPDATLAHDPTRTRDAPTGTAGGRAKRPPGP